MESLAHCRDRQAGQVEGCADRKLASDVIIFGNPPVMFNDIGLFLFLCRTLLFSNYQHFHALYLYIIVFYLMVASYLHIAGYYIVNYN
jgi:hypothetical protein